jgi:2-polyprenyl-6-methoxyphenol hydroxylase-like FAD-dependent oxidoreductase
MTTASVHHTSCCVVGGGPAGLFLSLLLARQGIPVTLLESHLDFDRDFRGDTVHPSTLELLHQLGLARAVHQLPHGKMRSLSIRTPEATYRILALDRLPTRFPYVMMLPQARFLDFLAAEARRYPSFRLVLGATATRLLCTGGQVEGVAYHDTDGAEHGVRATLTVGADGRFSKLRKLAGLEPIRSAPPMDVVWFRLPRRPDDPHELGTFATADGRFCVLLERETDWQVGYVIPKGGYQQLRAAGIERLRADLVRLFDWLGDRVGELRDWTGVTLLAVESSRLRRWYRPGLLLIGDAAHVMSPVGGVGINYAIQDAVATANLLAGPLKAGTAHPRHLAAVQARREWPTRAIQTVQGFMQRNLVAGAIDRGRPFRMPLLLRILPRVPLLRDLPARIVGFGFGRERIAQAH